MAFSPTGRLLASADNYDNTVWVLSLAPPSASITSPTGSGVYALGQSVTTAFSRIDAAYGPGIASCEGDPGPGIASRADSNAAESGPGRLDTGPVGPHAYTVTAPSKDGQTAKATINYAVAAPPTVTISAPANGARYPAGKVLDAGYGCQEGAYGPGLASCAGPVPNGTRLDTGTPGGHTFTFTVTSPRRSGRENHRHLHGAPPRQPHCRLPYRYPGRWDDHLAGQGPRPGQTRRARNSLDRVPPVRLWPRARQRDPRRLNSPPRDLNGYGTKLVHRHGHVVVLRLSVTYTPTYGIQHTVRLYGLHLPR